MPDGTKDAFLRAVENAADPTRFALLEHAATAGAFLETQAADIVGAAAEKGGTIRSHASRLHRFGLLDRSTRPITYSITPLGQEVYTTLSDMLRRSTSAGEGAEARLLLALLDPAGSGIESLMAQDEIEVVATVRTALKQAVTRQQAVLRVTRSHS